jgi:hypothetical protein
MAVPDPLLPFRVPLAIALGVDLDALSFEFGEGERMAVRINGERPAPEQAEIILAVSMSGGVRASLSVILQPRARSVDSRPSGPSRECS